MTNGAVRHYRVKSQAQQTAADAVKLHRVRARLRPLMSRSWLDSFDGRNVLVTGHTGFKGSWLVSWLLQLGARVTGIALPPEDDRPSMFRLLGLQSRINSHLIDIRDLKAISEVLARCQPEVVLHLAAQSLVRRSYAKPVDTYATNVMGTVHVLEAARRTPSVRSVVSVTSDKCYENRGWPWGYRESDAMGGHDPYRCTCAIPVQCGRGSTCSSHSRATCGSPPCC